MAIIGYARVSTEEQCLDLQLDLDRALAALQPGDTLTVWRLDRLSRSLVHLIGLVEELHSRGMQFQSMNEKIDTGSAAGELIFHVFGALAQFERKLIKERTKAGLEAAKSRGKKLGRKAKLAPSQVAHARELIATGRSQRDVARLFRVSHTSVRRALERTE
jgi:DNA invertase Pin-like site-specific DNA recombinase